jgi:hypothetical protein
MVRQRHFDDFANLRGRKGDGHADETPIPTQRFTAMKHILIN